MEVLLRSTLAGGVVMASAARLIEMPGIAILCGAVVGFVSAYQYVKNYKNNTKIATFTAAFVYFFPALVGHIIYLIMIGVNGDPVAKAMYSDESYSDQSD